MRKIVIIAAACITFGATLSLPSHAQAQMSRSDLSCATQNKLCERHCFKDFNPGLYDTPYKACMGNCAESKLSCDRAALAKKKLPTTPSEFPKPRSPTEKKKPSM